MDLINPQGLLDPATWGIVTNLESDALPYDRPPSHIAPTAQISHSAISAGCVIRGKVNNSVLSPGVVVEKDAEVNDSILMHDSMVSQGARINKVISDKKVEFGPGCRVGNPSASRPNEEYPKHLSSGITLVGKWAQIPKGAEVGGNCIIFPSCHAESWPSKKLPDGKTLKK